MWHAWWTVVDVSMSAVVELPPHGQVMGQVCVACQCATPHEEKGSGRGVRNYFYAARVRLGHPRSSQDEGGPAAYSAPSRRVASVEIAPVVLGTVAGGRHNAEQGWGCALDEGRGGLAFAATNSVAER